MRRVERTSMIFSSKSPENVCLLLLDFVYRFIFSDRIFWDNPEKRNIRKINIVSYNRKNPQI